MSFPSSTNNGLKIIRERIFINHTSADEREIIDEITVLNESNDKIPSILLPRKDFMVGLKVLDASNREIPFLTNYHTRELISSMITKTILGTPVYSETLDKINTHKIFVLWIRLPQNNPIEGYEPIIIKLSYHNKTKPMKLKFRDTLYHQKYLFSIPRFRTENVKSKSDKYDTFYIITAPNGFTLDYKILKNVKIQQGKEIELTKEDGVYIDYNEKIFSLRIPALEQENKFDMMYDVIPRDNERWFYTVTVFTMIGISIVTAMIGVKWLNPNLLTIFTQIYNHANAIFGGVVTASLAAIGLLKSPSTVRTRFWFLIPAVISAIGFLFKI